jgi:hypothetical protein
VTADLQWRRDLLTQRAHNREHLPSGAYEYLNIKNNDWNGAGRGSGGWLRMKKGRWRKCATFEKNEWPHVRRLTNREGWYRLVWKSVRKSWPRKRQNQM